MQAWGVTSSNGGGARGHHWPAGRRLEVRHCGTGVLIGIEHDHPNAGVVSRPHPNTFLEAGLLLGIGNDLLVEHSLSFLWADPLGQLHLHDNGVRHFDPPIPKPPGDDSVTIADPDQDQNDEVEAR